MPNPRSLESRSDTYLSCRRLRGAALATAALGLPACSGNVVDLGQNAEEFSLPANSRCQASETLAGSIVVQHQEELDQLTGCKTIQGDLLILSFPDADLRPLRALTTVAGNLMLIRDPFWAGPKYKEEIKASYEPSAGEWLTSLAGLEHLEFVGGLQVDDFSGATLAPLSNLRHASRLVLSQCPNLENAGGLDNLSPVPSLQVSACRNLRDLTALRLAEEMTALDITRTPVEAIAANDLRWLESGSIDRTALANLDAFSNLEMVGSALAVTSNPALEDVDGLDTLTSVSALQFTGNPELHRVTLNGMTNISAFIVKANAKLTELPSFALRNSLQGPRSTPVWQGADTVFDVSENSSLRQVTLPHTSNMGDLNIARNPQLEHIELSGLQLATTFTIEGNPALASVNSAALSAVALLSIKDNPLLDASPFDGVQAFERQISGNASSAP